LGSAGISFTGGNQESTGLRQDPTTAVQRVVGKGYPRVLNCEGVRKRGLDERDHSAISCKDHLVAGARDDPIIF